MINTINWDLIKGIRYFPMKFSIFFLSLTLLMFSFSPWEWELSNKFYFYFLNISYLVFLYFGFRMGFAKYKIKNKIVSFSFNSVLNVSILLNLFLLYPKFLFRLKVPSLSLTEFINTLLLGLFDPSLAYAAKHQSEFNDFLTLSNPITLIYFLTLPLQYFGVILGVFYWSKLNLVKKVLIFIFVLSDIFSYIMIGTNKGIFDYIILIPTVLIIKNPSYLKIKNITKLNNLKYYSFFIVILILGIGYFVEGNKGRKNDNFGYDFSIDRYANRESAILTLLPDFLDDSYIALDSYLTSGYYAMGLGLELDNSFTFGLGHNSFFISLGEKVLGEGVIANKTYQKRIEDSFGWSSSMKWHTFYVWMANDISFIGVVFLLFFVGYYFSQIWYDALFFNNPYALVLLPLFFTMILYLPANNQVLGNQGSSFIFWSFFFLWLNSKGSSFQLS